MSTQPSPTEIPRRDPRSLRSRAALRKALADLLAERPIEQISAATLTRAAGIGYATFFRNYADVDALLAELAEDLIDALSNELVHLPENPDREAVARRIMQFADRHRALMKPLLLGASATVERKILSRALHQAEHRPAPSAARLPVRLAISHPVVTILNILRAWLEDDEGMDLEDMAELISTLAFKPVKAFSPGGGR